MIGDWLSGMSAPMIWGIIALVLAAVEIIVPGVFLIWIALAAAITAVAGLILPLSLPFQMLIFAVFSAISVSGGRLWYLAQPDKSSDPMLNDRAARLVGRSVTVTDAIVQGEGRVRVDDSSWMAIGPDAPTGARMTVVEVDGGKLVVAFPAA